MRKICSSLFALVIALLVVWYLNQPIDTSRVELSKRASVNAACLIVKDNHTGSGVLLESGYVLTAAHVVGHPEDEEERAVTLIFYGDIRRTFKGRVAYVSEEHDFAFVEPLSIDFTSTIKLATVAPLVGTNIYTVGAPLGKPLLISPGIIGEGLDGVGRTVCHIVWGNSGGGVFDSKTNVLYGILNRVDTIHAAGQFRTFVPSGPDTLVAVQGHFQFKLPIFAMSMYVPAEAMENELVAKNILGMLRAPKQQWIAPDEIVWWSMVAITIAQCVTVLVISVWLARVSAKMS